MKHAIEQIAIYVSRMSGIRWTDIVEIIILSFLIYHILVWIKNTKAWSLLKGILVIAVFILFAAYFEMNTILWIVNNLFSVAVTAVVVILQPELRRAVEELGRKNIISSIIPITVGRGRWPLLRQDHQRNCESMCRNGKGKNGCPHCYGKG